MRRQTGGWRLEMIPVGLGRGYFFPFLAAACFFFLSVDFGDLSPMVCSSGESVTMAAT